MEAIGLLLIKLRKVLRSRGRTLHDADDLIQEAFLRLQLYCRDKPGKPVEQTEAFLVRTALNLSIDQHRRAHHRLAIGAPVETLALIDTQPLPDEIFATQQRLRRVKQALNALSPRAREVFILNRAEGYSYGQIAQRLGVSVSTVEKHMAKAALFFDEWLDREGQE